MSLPLHMNLVEVELGFLVSPSSTDRDPDYGELRDGRKKRYQTVTTKAQVVYAASERQSVMLTGAPGETIGRLVMRMSTAEELQRLPEAGDKITSIGGSPTKFKIIESRPTAFLAGVANTLSLLFVADDEVAPAIRR